MAGVPAIQRNGGGLPADPRNVKDQQAKADALISYAAKVKDWPLLESAIDLKIEQQREFVRWWDETVSIGHGLGRGHKKVSVSETFLPADQADALTGIDKVQVSRWRKRLGDEAKYRDQQIQAAYRKAGLEPEANHRAEGTGENEWFTPEQYIEAAREVMGGIDLDPATHPIAQKIIGAERFFTADDDGLKQHWHGRVWLNPPYAQPLIGQFAAKLVEEISAGRVAQAIMLTHNYTDTSWFHQAEAAADLICFTRGRIKFVDADGDECAPTQGQAFFYHGPAGDSFRLIFSQFGFIR
jgi:phage N-6-adenine-methyltransferase